ncbi:LLM class flavin-dependent oxidoreductase [Lysinibacillus macroides]|uniref:Luciferase-like domain-containing protein n=1 Tax=Lysinibacillus macroides TaxID=33935 RepID=A0A0M9DK27_9BACI|nr:LLM class flavin-dependent oxidoreductase [Lysinibacillus macroides]KOY82010.1 hypothetical protein ADM90_11990 [Lysinibacillus macroides]QPR67215.1 LLM class flavin-dependent oxidoreductase [Lysinibacillus macroides]
MNVDKKTLKLATTLIAPRAASGGWRHPSANLYLEEPGQLYKQLIKKAEQGKLDYVFQPDQYRVSATSPEEFAHTVNVWLEPITLLSAMSAVSEHIGLAATLSTTYNEPYHVARMLASLDHLSKGRASWNVVTSRGDSEASNFKMDHRPTSDERDKHSALFVDIVKSLWDSWGNDAIVANKTTGIFAHPEKIHAVNHESEWFSVKGPLNVARPPQGHPVIIQAGQSDAFKERAARSADIIFTMLNTLSEAQAFYQNVKSRLGRYGRGKNDLLIMPGLQIIVGKTAKEAYEKQRYIQELERLEDIRRDRLAYLLGIDIGDLSLDDTLPEVSSSDINGKYRKLKELAEQKGWKTIRELYTYLEANTGHLLLVGTPMQIADQMEKWLRKEGADGFIFIPHILPSGLDDFVDHVIPALQERGIFRKDYEGSTLRENLGLACPENTYQ